MKYWLFKSEPSAYSIDDLKRDKVEPWDGIRNYQARNFLRDKIKKGDLVLFYHSNTKSPGVVGLARAAGGAHPDPTQFDSKDAHYDPKSLKDAPRWYLVNVRFVEKFQCEVTLEYLKSKRQFSQMTLTKKGSRLSIQPVSQIHFDLILKKGRTLSSHS